MKFCFIKKPVSCFTAKHLVVVLSWLLLLCVLPAVDKKTTAAQRSAAHKKPTAATPLFLLPQSGVIKLGHPGAAIKYRF